VVRLLTIRCFCTASTTSSTVKFGRSATRANRQVACFSIGETLPSVGIAATLRVSYQRCSHLIAELEAISKRSAAFRDAPASTASTTRLRKSLEQGLVIDRPQKRPTNAAETRSFNEPRKQAKRIGGF
jgi:hypothetical protein